MRASLAAVSATVLVAAGPAAADDRPAEGGFGVDALAQTLRDEHPDAFAGLWLDDGAGTVVVAAVGDGSAVLDTARDHFVEPDRLVVEPADYSEAELVRAHDELVAVFSELTEASVFSLGVDVRRNRVAIGAEHPDDVDLAAHVADDVVGMTVIDAGTAPRTLERGDAEESAAREGAVATPEGRAGAAPILLGAVALAVSVVTLGLLAWRRRRPGVP